MNLSGNDVFHILILMGFSFIAGLIAESEVTQSDVGAANGSYGWKTTIHNAAHTGDKITVDGIDYHVIVMPKPVELQAHRSEYARRCQAITGKFFEEIGNATNK